MLALDWTRDGDPPLSLGHASILSSLKQQCRQKQIAYHQHVSSIEISVNSQQHQCDKYRITQQVLHKLKSIQSMQSERVKLDLAIGVFIWNEAIVQCLLSQLENDSNYQHLLSQIILGGPQITYSNATDLPSFYPSAHLFIRGYAEQAMANVFFHRLDAQRKGDGDLLLHPGIILNANKYTSSDREQRRLQKSQNKADNIASPKLADLASPFLSDVMQLEHGFVRWETQRGCPFACSFCQHPGLIQNNRKVDEHGNTHQRRIEEEVKWFIANKIVKINVLDPTFNNNQLKQHYLDVLKLLHDYNYAGKLSLQCRLELVNEEFMDAICRLKYGNGCDVLLEFGIQTLVKEEMHAIGRYNNLTKIRRNLAAINDHKIPYEMSIIYGLPNQTVQSFEYSIATLRAMTDTDISTIKAFPLMILRGTKLDSSEIRRKYGIVEDADLAHQVFCNMENTQRQLQNIPHVIQTNTYSTQDWIAMSHIAARLESDEQRFRLLP